jgi:hypothetical protein
MNTKTLSFLAILTVIVIITAVVLTQPQTPEGPEKTPLFPNLKTVSLNDVTEINITTRDENITLMRSDKQWGLKEKHDYPVAIDKVHNLLFGLAGLTILEAKTSNPALYSKIGVEAVTEEDAQSTLLILKNAQGGAVASVIIGNDRTAKIDSTRQEIYVRKPDDKQSWLTLGRLPVEKTIGDWLEENIIDIEGDKVREINMTHPDGETLRIYKATPENKDYQLADLPENASIKSPYTLRSLAGSLSHLNLDDVRKSDDIEFAEDNTHRAVFTTFDGLEVTVEATKIDGKHYVQLSAAFNPDMVWAETRDEEGKDEAPKDSVHEMVIADDKTPDEPEVDIEEEVETLNAKFKGWVYELAAYKVEEIEKKRDDFIEFEDEEAGDNEDIKLDNMDIEGLENLPLSMPELNMPGLNMPELERTPNGLNMPELAPNGLNMPELDSPPKPEEAESDEAGLSSPFSFSNVIDEKVLSTTDTPSTTIESDISVP